MHILCWLLCLAVDGVGACELLFGMIVAWRIELWSTPEGTACGVSAGQHGVDLTEAGSHVPFFVVSRSTAQMTEWTS